MSTQLRKCETQSPATQTNTYRRPYYTVTGGKDAYEVQVFMPGVAKDDYNISLDRDELLVEGKKVVPLPTDAQWLHREITAESYKLRLQLNVDVEESEITASSDNGILKVTLPVAREARPRTIQIS